MAEQGHGYHWECVTNPDDLVKKQLPNLLQNGQLENKEEVNAIFFDDGMQSTETLFSIAVEDDFSALALIVSSRDKISNQFVSGYPFVRNGKKIALKITEIKEWDNKYEAVIVTETVDEYTISFFDTKYYKNKGKYKIGKTYTFVVAALAYNVEILKEKSFAFEGQKAVDWLAKIGNHPTYDAQGNVEPVVFDLSNLVTYLPRTEYPDDAEFQSPINRIETVRAFDNEFYKFNITIFRNPDICIDLYAKISFFECKPEINEPLRGVLWLQGYLQEETKLQSGLLDSNYEPIINSKR
jgi:hypothetical protein